MNLFVKNSTVVDSHLAKPILVCFVEFCLPGSAYAFAWRMLGGLSENCTCEGGYARPPSGLQNEVMTFQCVFFQIQ